MMKYKIYKQNFISRKRKHKFIEIYIKYNNFTILFRCNKDLNYITYYSLYLQTSILLEKEYSLNTLLKIFIKEYRLCKIRNYDK